MSGGSSGGGGWIGNQQQLARTGEWYPGMYCRMGYSGGQVTHVNAGDDNFLLRLDKDALTVLSSKLTPSELWDMRWAMEKAFYVKEVMNNRPSRADHGRFGEDNRD